MVITRSIAGPKTFFNLFVSSSLQQSAECMKIIRLCALVKIINTIGELEDSQLL